MKKFAIVFFILLSYFTPFFSQTKLCDCTRENVISVSLLNKKPVVQWYKKTEGLISVTKEYYIDIGNKTVGPYSEPCYLMFSPNGERLAYCAKINGQEYAFVDDTKDGPYDKVDMRFTADNMLVYEAITGQSKVFLMNNKKVWPYDADECKLYYSPDNRTTAYIAKADGKYYIVSNKTKVGPYDCVPNISFAPDNTLVYSVKIDDSWYLFEHNNKTKLPGKIINGPVFSLDCRTVAYFAKTAQGGYLFVGNEKAGPYAHVDEIVFSPNGNRLAYITADKYFDEFCVVVDRQIHGPYKSARCLCFSSDSKHFSYSYVQSYHGDNYYIVNDDREEKYEEMGYVLPSPLNDGTLVYSAQEYYGIGWFVCFNGRKYATHGKATQIMLSPDKENVIYVSNATNRSGDNKYYIGVNDKTFGPYGFASICGQPSNNALGCFVECNKEAADYVIVYTDRDAELRIGTVCNGLAVYLEDGAIWVE